MSMVEARWEGRKVRLNRTVMGRIWSWAWAADHAETRPAAGAVDHEIVDVVSGDITTRVLRRVPAPLGRVYVTLETPEGVGVGLADSEPVREAYNVLGAVVKGAAVRAVFSARALESAEAQRLLTQGAISEEGPLPEPLVAFIYRPETPQGH